MPTGVGSISAMTTNHKNKAAQYTTEDGNFFSSNQVQEIMDLMQCDEAQAHHICELIDWYGDPDYSADSDQGLRDYYQYCLDEDARYAE